MAYVKTDWQNGVTPVNADNMNKIEGGIENALAKPDAVLSSNELVGVGTSGEQIRVQLGEGLVLEGTGSPYTLKASGGGGTQLYWHSISLLPGATSSGTVFEFTIFSYSNSEYDNATIVEYVKNHGGSLTVSGYIGDNSTKHPISYITTANDNLSIYYSTEIGEVSFELFDNDVITDYVTPL